MNVAEKPRNWPISANRLQVERTNSFSKWLNRDEAAELKGKGSGTWGGSNSRPGQSGHIPKEHAIGKHWQLATECELMG